MSDLDLDAIKKRCEAATPGPWVRYADSPKTQHIVAPSVEHIDVDEADWGPEVGNVLAVGTLSDPRAWRYADVEFIAAARSDVPALVAEVERLRTADARHEEREAHWAGVLGVPDGGSYRNDWDVYLQRLRAAVALHRTDAGYVCLGCAHWWPCPTVRAASGEGDRGDA